LSKKNPETLVESEMEHNFFWENLFGNCRLPPDVVCSELKGRKLPYHLHFTL